MVRSALGLVLTYRWFSPSASPACFGHRGCLNATPEPQTGETFNGHLVQHPAWAGTVSASPACSEPIQPSLGHSWGSRGRHSCSGHQCLSFALLYMVQLVIRSRMCVLDIFQCFVLCLGVCCACFKLLICAAKAGGLYNGLYLNDSVPQGQVVCTPQNVVCNLS